MNFEERTHYCGELNSKNIGERVTLLGWVRKQRDLGSLIFVDLRDRSGIVQLVFSEETNPKEFHVAKRLKSEYVIGIKGTVKSRGEKDKNLNLKTGEIEVVVDEIEILSESETPPFPIEDDITINEEIRLEYRYLDLRRPIQNERIQKRHKLLQIIRNHLSTLNFLEIETPFLTRSTPEGARDFLVPSRLRPGSFYALPQSPQLFKQICMVAGFDRYFQIVRCFRDEDLRADRQPEFTQIDIEISFPTVEGIMKISESLLKKIFDEFSYEVDFPPKRLTYKEAMEKYGTDKPDLRFDLELKNITHIVSDSNFRVFKETIEKGGVIKGIKAPAEFKITRKEHQNLEEITKKVGAKGVIVITRKDGKAEGMIVKHLTEGIANSILDEFKTQNEESVLIVADTYKIVSASLSLIRSYIAKILKLYENKKNSLVWIHPFPAFEWSEEEGRWVSCHHPFTMIREEDKEWLEKDPSKVEALAYDIVLNGNEIGGGSIRIHNSDLQKKIFKTLGLCEKEASEKFGFLLEAFKYGVPPHGGIAFGLDRIAMLIMGCESIRDVIPFPKTTSGLCLMTKSPSEVDEKQLKELKIKIERE